MFNNRVYNNIRVALKYTFGSCLFRRHFILVQIITIKFLSERPGELEARFLFILLDEAVAIRRAQTLRFGYCSLPNGYRSLAMLAGLLFTRVLMRYQQMTTTLDIKLYQGDFHL